MKDDVDVRDRGLESRVIVEIAFDKIEIPGDLFEVMPIARDKVVDDPHLCSLSDQLIGEI
jgi:hypothetical protein